MSAEIEQHVHELDLLKVMLEIRNWEDVQLHEFQTISGRHLYFSLAETLLDEPNVSQRIKQLRGQVTERATRQRIREFVELGLVEISNNQNDQRAKNVIPTRKFITHLNSHLAFFKMVCEQRFLMLNKNNLASDQVRWS